MYLKQSWFRSSPAAAFSAGKSIGSLDGVVRFFVVVSALVEVGCVAITVT